MPCVPVRYIIGPPDDVCVCVVNDAAGFASAEVRCCIPPVPVEEMVPINHSNVNTDFSGEFSLASAQKLSYINTLFQAAG